MQPKLGQTQYYSRTVNGQQTYAALPYAGNHPYDYTPISKDQYAAGLQGQIGSGAKAPNGAPSLDQQLADVQGNTGIHAPGYVDPTFSKFQANAPTPSSDYLTPEAKAQYDSSLSNLNTLKANVPDLAAKYNATHQTLQSSGKDAPVTPGAGAAGVSGATPPPPPPGPNTGAITTALQGSDGISSWMQNFQQQFSQENQQTTLAQDYQTMTQQLGIPALNTQLMNMKNVMDGTENDIRNEVTKAGGFATDSQVQALTNARNKTLIQNYNNLLNQKSMLQDQVNTMIGLEEKDRSAAHQQLMDQFQIGTKLAEMQQTMQKNAQDSMFNNIKQFGAKAVYDAAVASGDPTAIARINSMMGPGFDIATVAAQPNLDDQLKQAQIANTKANTAKTYNDIANNPVSSSGSASNQYSVQSGDTYKQLADRLGTTVDALRQANPGVNENNLQIGQKINLSQQAFPPNKQQEKLEQQYREVLVKEIQSRSGTLGTEDAKVAQANHLSSLMNQYYDPNTGDYNVPKAQYGELVLGLAGMLSKTGTPTETQTDNINTATAKGDLNKALTYATGQPTNGTTQAVIKNLADSIDRQANTAVSNRDAAVKLLQGLAPTGLDPARRAALERNTLVPYTPIKKGVQPTQPVLSNGIDLSKFLK